MGIIELVLGIILVLMIVNLVLAFVPIPRSISGLIVGIIIIYLLLRLL